MAALLVLAVAMKTLCRIQANGILIVAASLAGSTDMTNALWVILLMGKYHCPSPLSCWIASVLFYARLLGARTANLFCGALLLSLLHQPFGTAELDAKEASMEDDVFLRHMKTVF